IVIVAYLLPARTVAQSTQSNASQQSVEEIRKQLALLKEQMSTLETRLNEIESAKAPTRPAPAAPAAPAPPAEKQEGTIQSAETPSQGQTSRQVGDATATFTQFSEDKVAAARFDNVPLDPKYKGYFRLPGTQTLLKIGGYFKTDFIYDLKPAGNTDSFIPSSIPVPNSVNVNNSTVSIRPTRLNLDFRIPS